MSASGAINFSFGDPEPVLHGRGLLDYLNCWQFSEWYEPPIDMTSLAQAFHAAVHHASAIHVKRNILLSTMRPSKLITRQAASRLFKESMALGNCYLEKVNSRSGKVLSYQPAVAKYVRRSVKDLTQYCQVTDFNKPHWFKPGSIWHWMEPDLQQEIYGIPEWLAALHSALLNEAATLFRRKYYANGSHAGYILYMNDPAQKQEDIDAIRKSLKDSKGPGNFRNLFVYSPNGSPDGIKVIPVSDAATKDEFLNIKNTTRDDQLAAHRVPWQIMGIPPTSGVNGGDPLQVAKVFARNEVKPLQDNFLAANEFFGDEIFQFDNYEIEETKDALLPR